MTTTEMRRALMTACWCALCGSIAFAVTRALVPPREVDAAPAPAQVRDVAFAYRAPTARPSPPDVTTLARARSMLALQADLREVGPGLSQAWPSVYETLMVRLHELAGADDGGAAIRACFDGPAPGGLRLSLALDSTDTGLRATAIQALDERLSDATRACLSAHLAAGFEVTLAETERPPTPLHVTLIVPFIVGTTGDVYADLPPRPAAP